MEGGQFGRKGRCGNVVNMLTLSEQSDLVIVQCKLVGCPFIRVVAGTLIWRGGSFEPNLRCGSRPCANSPARCRCRCCGRAKRSCDNSVLRCAIMASRSNDGVF